VNIEELGVKNNWLAEDRQSQINSDSEANQSRI
jgi:hypothetical protein